MSRNPTALLHHLVTRPAAICGAIIAALALVVFWPLVVSPSQTLFSKHSDLLAMHLPMKHFLVQSFQETGEIPNWCPSSFAGLPFTHDVQLAAFYPLHLPLYFLPPKLVGAAVSWLTVLHVMVAGWGMLLYSRKTKLSWHGSLAAAVAWMFAGKWMLHLIEGGHSIVAPLAWLPLVLWCLHHAMEQTVSVRVRVRWSCIAGLFFGMMILGTHPQVLFYCGIGIAVSLIVQAAIRDTESNINHRLFWAIGGGAICALVAVGCGAVQLLPALEATPLTSRAEGVPPSDTLPGGVRVLLNFFGPAIVALKTSGRWEDRGGFAFLTVMLAAFAFVARRSEPNVRRQVWTFGILIAYSMGVAILFQALPGFRLFRQATRMVLVAALPMAWLAGAGLEAVALELAERKRFQRAAMRVVAVAVLLCGGLALRTMLSGDTVLSHPYWISLAITLPASVWLLRRGAAISADSQRHAWVALVAIDAAMIGMPSVDTQTLEEIYPVGTITKSLVEKCQPGDRILDRDATAKSYASPFGTGMPLALFHGLEPVRGYNSFDLADYRRYLKRISGDETALMPFEDTWTFPLIGDFPVRDQAAANLLGIRYLVAPENASMAEPWSATPWSATEIFESTPAGYSVIEGGVVPTPAYRVWKNGDAFPKAWTVSERSVVGAMSAGGGARTGVEPANFSLPEVLRTGPSAITPATLSRYEPNLIEIEVHNPSKTLLVVTDAWFPGWECTIDGRPAEINRVERLFRGVWLPAGAKQVRFQFHPKSLSRGRMISVTTLCGVLLLVGISFSRKRIQQVAC